MAKVLSLDAYKREKIRMLQDEFFIQLTEHDIKRINEQKSEMMVDGYACWILKERL